MGSGVSVLFTLLVSRYLETASASRFFLLFNMSTIAATCFRWGLDEVIIRKVASAPADKVPGLARYLVALAHRRVFLWGLVGLAPAAALAHPAVRAAASGLSAPEAAVVVVASALVALMACAARVQQGVGRTNLATFLLNIFVPLLSLTGLLVLVGVGVKVTALGLILLYAAIAMIAYLGVVFVRYGVRIALPGALRLLSDTEDRRADLRAANKLGGVVLAQQVLSWGSLLIVPFAYGAAAYNGFVVAQKIATLISLVMLAVNFTLSSRFAALHAAGRTAELRKIARTAAAAIIGSSLLVSLTVILFRTFVFEFARIEADLTGVLAILLLGQVFFALSALFSVILSMCRDEGFLLYAQGAVNLSGVLVFMIASRFATLEVACGAFLASYLVLSLVLGLRARALGVL
jgi:O-antigen/teichoic acid export membrane protein